jgi:hypothetical protein
MDEQDWEARVAALWTAFDDHDPAGFVARVDGLAAELPDGDARALFERACARDSTGQETEAEALYRAAMDAGLTGIRRRRAAIQYASTLRNLGRPAESAAILFAERQGGSDELDDAVTGLLALALTDLGLEREAASLALGALAPHLPRYQRSLASYASALVSATHGIE